jgi:Rrf2 family iron-responsive transcriptional regulator
MQLTLRTHHAMRLLMFCALNGPRAAPVSRIARQWGMSEAHLAKIAHQLSLLGLVETVRGRSGGVRLGRDSRAISVGDVIRATECTPMAGFGDDGADEGGAAENAAANGAATGEALDESRLRVALSDAFGAFMQVLDGYSIADLVAADPETRALLGLDIDVAAPSGRRSQNGPLSAHAPACA